MEPILEVSNLYKRYPGFSLENISFRLEAGQIMGFLGRNGAGKTTTIKAILNLCHPDSGTVRILGQPLDAPGVRARIGYAAGGAAFYPRKTLGAIADLTRPFYPQWEEEAYRHYCNVFHLDQQKQIRALSEGMKVKFQLALALSHGAKLLLLDEPSSGLDPVSREELRDIFRQLAAKGTAIFFSTHITSDLCGCADCVTYLQKGRLLASKPMDAFLADHPDCKNLEEIMVKLEKEEISL